MNRPEVRGALSNRVKEAWARGCYDGVDRRKWSGTTTEAVVAALLKSEGLDFIEQYRVGRYVVDFFVPEKNLLVEAHGCYWHACTACGFEDAEKTAYDNQRAAVLRAKGYELRIVWQHEVMIVRTQVREVA